MWDVRACRACLATDTESLQRATTVLRKIFESISGFEFQESDGFPPYLCGACRGQLRRAVALRRRCRRAVLALRHAAAAKQSELLEDDIRAVDRKRNNLLPPLALWTASAEYKLHEIDEQTFLEPLTAVMETGAIAVHEVRSADAPEPQPECDEVHDYEDGPNSQDQVLDDFEPMDVFEGLKEEKAQSSSDGLSDAFDSHLRNAPSRPVVRTRRRRGAALQRHRARERLRVMLEAYSKAAKQDSSIDTKALAVCLASCQIRQLSLEEQKIWFNKRLQHPQYVNAVYKCAVCVKSFGGIEELKAHCKATHRKDPRHQRHACPVCPRALPSRARLDAHRAREHAHQYRCALCPATCLNVASLYAHMLQHGTLISPEIETRYGVNIKRVNQTPEDWERYRTPSGAPGSCGACAFAPPGPAGAPASKNLLARHVSSHSRRDRTAQCDVCSTWHVNKASLERHVLKTHRYLYKCLACDANFSYQVSAEQHSHTHTDEYPCEVVGCDYVARTLTQHSYHRLTEHPSGAAAVGAVTGAEGAVEGGAEGALSWCALCGRGVRGACRLYRHQLLRHGLVAPAGSEPVDRSCYCVKCSLQFRFPEALLVHRDSHPQPYPRTCEECGETFASKPLYATHACRQTAGYPLLCPLCGVLVACPKAHRRHQTAEHPGRPLATAGLLCHACGRTFRSAPGLACHAPCSRRPAGHDAHDAPAARRARARVVLACSLCEFRGSAARVFHHHMRAHVPRPYRCRACGRRETRETIRRHMLTYHEKIKRETCEVCSKKYSCFEHLKKHMYKVHKIVINIRSSGRRETDRGMWLRRAFVYRDVEVDCTLLSQEVIDHLELALYSLRNEYIGDVTALKYEYLKRYDEPLDSELEAKFAQTRERYCSNNRTRNRRARETKKQTTKITDVEEFAVRADLEEESKPKVEARDADNTAPERDMPQLELEVKTEDVTDDFKSPNLIVKKNVAERVFVPQKSVHDTIIVKKIAKTSMRTPVTPSQMPVKVTSQETQTPLMKVKRGAPVRNLIPSLMQRPAPTVLNTVKSPVMRAARPNPETHALVVKKRRLEEDNPVVFPGVVASNEVVVDAEMKDEQEIVEQQVIDEGQVVIEGLEGCEEQVIELDESAFDTVEGDKYVMINGQLFKVVNS